MIAWHDDFRARAQRSGARTRNRVVNATFAMAHSDYEHAHELGCGHRPALRIRIKESETGAETTEGLQVDPAAPPSTRGDQLSAQWFSRSRARLTKPTIASAATKTIIICGDKSGATGEACTTAVWPAWKDGSLQPSEQ